MLMSLPYVIRLRQCLIEFQRSGGTGTQHLMNALKYASAFPVILLSAMQRTYISPVEDKYPDKVWFGESMLFRLWYSTSKRLLTQDPVCCNQLVVFILVGRRCRLESHNPH